MANILLISYHFPPFNEVGCRRMYFWAKYLKKRGQSVIILTADTPDDNARNNFNVDLSFLEIHRERYFDIRRLVKKILKTQGPLSDGYNRSNKKTLKILFLKKILDIINVFFSSKGILFGYARCPTFSDQWFFSAYRKAKNIIKEKKIDVIITSFPPPVVNVLGYRLKKKFKNILWIQDFRDPWVRNTMHKGIWPFNFLEKYLERKSCKNADIITVVSDIWADWFKVDYSSKLKNIFVIKNGYDKESVDNIVSCSNHDEFIKVNEKKNLLHIGSLYKINDNIELIFRAIEEGRFQFEEYLRIVFYGAYETFAFLNGYMERYPKAKRIVQYKGFLSAEEVLRKESQADAFLLMKNNKNDGVIPMKVFEYMAFKKPIIGVCLTQSSYLGDILKKTGLGVFCGGDISRIEEALILVSTGEVKISPNNDFIEGFSREAQVKNLNYIIESRLNWGGFLSSSK